MQHFGRQSKFTPPAYSPVVWDAKRPATLAGYWMMDSSWECGSQQDSQSSTQKETHLKLLNYDKVQEPPKKHRGGTSMEHVSFQTYPTDGFTNPKTPEFF